MRNESDVKAALTAYLEADTPARCNAIAERTGLPTPHLHWFPHPARDPGASDWPPAFVSGNGRAGMRVVETDEHGDDIYEIRYRMLVEVWVTTEKADDYAGADDLRAREEQAVVESLLDDMGLATEALTVDETTIESRPSDIFENDQGLQAQAVEISFEVISAETLVRAALAEPPIDVDVSNEHLDLED